MDDAEVTDRGGLLPERAEGAATAVDVDALAAIGRQVGAAARESGPPAVEGLVAAAGALATALPGSRSAVEAGALAGRWARAGAGWVGDAAAHGDALVASAGDYATVDTATADALGRVGTGR